jgi:hypothetical protein
MRARPSTLLALALAACAAQGCGGTTTRTVTRSVTTTATKPQSPPATPQGQVVALPGVGSISYRCRPGARKVAATFTSAPLSATAQVKVSETGRQVARATVQPSDPGSPQPHELSAPPGAYHSLEWLITQATEPHLVVARVRLDFVLTTARYQGRRFPVCDMPHWTADVKVQSTAGPNIAVEGVPRAPSG